MAEKEKKLEERVSNSSFSNDLLFNVAGKLMVGYCLYELGKFGAGDFGAIVGAYVGLSADYSLVKN